MYNVWINYFKSHWYNIVQPNIRPLLYRAFHLLVINMFLLYLFFVCSHRPSTVLLITAGPARSFRAPWTRLCRSATKWKWTWPRQTIRRSRLSPKSRRWRRRRLLKRQSVGPAAKLSSLNRSTRIANFCGSRSLPLCRYPRGHDNNMHEILKLLCFTIDWCYVLCTYIRPAVSRSLLLYYTEHGGV